MTLANAFRRLRWRFSPDENGKMRIMTPNKEDVDSFNEICKHNSTVCKLTVYQENKMFAKLYTFILCELTNHYTDIDEATKEINRILSEPVDFHAAVLHQKIKETEYRNFFYRKGILDPFLKTKTAKELEEAFNNHKDRFPELDQKEFLKVGNNWAKEDVNYQLENSINLSLQNFKNHV